MSLQQSQDVDRFRKTIFCASNPNKELNPAKHIIKRPMDKILNQLNQNDISITAPKQTKPTIMNVNEQTYCYNREIEQPINAQLNAKKKVGKKLFDDKLKENVGKNIIVNPPINSTEQLNVRKGSGHYYQGKNTESYMISAYYPNTSKAAENKKKLFESKKLNKETITTELTNNINHHDKYRPSSVSQRRQIPQKTTIQDCFNDFPQSTKESNRSNQAYQQYYTTARPSRSTTTHDSFNSGQVFNKPLSQQNSQNMIRKTNAYYKYGTSTTTHSSFYL